MFKSLRAQIVLAALAAIFTIPVVAQSAEAQAGDRMRVLVPHMQATDGSDEDFGKRVSERVRDRLDLDRHVAIDDDEVDDAAREFDMRFDDLNCIFSRQLAPQVGAGIVMCGEYQSEGEQVQVQVRFITIPEGAELSIESFAVADDQETEAAERIVSEFQVLAEQIALISYCDVEARSGNWTQARDYCSRAVEAVPDTRGPRFNLGEAEMELGNHEVALEQFQILLERDPGDDDALERAGYSAAQLGQSDVAFDYYSRYLEINPDNVNVRANVAYELASSGDPRGAMDLITEGLEAEPDNLGLLEQYGSYAFRAARDLQNQRPASQDADQAQDPEVVELYREATGALMQVVEAEGAEANPIFVVNSVRAHIQLGEYDEALRVAGIGTDIFTDNADVWSERAVAANRAGETDTAITSLERAIELNPELPNARSRMAQYYLSADRIDEAVEALMAAAAAGERSPDELAQTLLQRAFNDHINPQEDLLEGARLLDLAKELEVTDPMRHQLNFFHGYAIYQHAIPVEAAETVESAQAALPLFQEAQGYFQAAEPGYAQNQSWNLPQILEAVDQYIDRQERIIERGGRR